MPARIGDLAVVSGRPAFAEPLHVGRPNLGNRAALLRRIERALDKRWLTNDGDLLREFELRVADVTGADECVVVVNATVGLQLLARALGLSGDVVLPAWTFVGTAHALSWIGLNPVFADIDAASHNLDPEAVERVITPSTSAILGVHLWGRARGADRLADVAERHRVPLVFDAAHALGCTYGGRQLGTLGAASVFSFHATKVANAAEGGAITTSDRELAKRLRSMRSFGFCAYDTVSELGTNAKMNELSAAMGITSLDALEDFTAANRRNYSAYAAGLATVPGLRLLEYDDRDSHNYHYVVVEVDASASALRRDELVAVLHRENVLARRYFHPGCHRMEPYRGTHVSLPMTEEVSSRVVVLPTGSAVSKEAVEVVCSIIAIAAQNPDEVRRGLGAPGRG